MLRLKETIHVARSDGGGGFRSIPAGAEYEEDSALVKKYPALFETIPTGHKPADGGKSEESAAPKRKAAARKTASEKKDEGGK